VLTNSHNNFGSVAKILHWLVALLVIVAFALGIYLDELPRPVSEAEREHKFFVLSVHKTIGVTTFFLAALRIVWAIVNRVPKPYQSGIAALHKFEHFLARVVHGGLYASIVALPLTGWLSHAAGPGRPPLFLPFGSNLPFVPESMSLARTFISVHHILPKIMVVCLVLHVLGALKHHFIDRDDTFRRIVPGWKLKKNKSIRAVHQSQPVVLITVGVYTFVVLILLWAV